MLLDAENYYSAEADRAYMSCSQYQGFLECEAHQMAKLEGRWTDEPKEAFLVGNYFHSYFEGPEAHEKFCDNNFDQIFKTKTSKKTGAIVVTGKYAPFEKADAMINAAVRDPFIKGFLDMPGENEKIMTGTLFGIPWKIRIDKYISDGRVIVDYKTVANIQETSYNPITRERETFVEAYGYIMRAAVYSEIEKQHSTQEKLPHFILICLSKQDPPDKEVLSLNHSARYTYELEQIKERLGRIHMVKSGAVRPLRCGACEYCRATKRLSEIKPYYRLMPQFRERRQEDEHGSTEGSLLAQPQEAGVVDGVSAV